MSIAVSLPSFSSDNRRAALCQWQTLMSQYKQGSLLEKPSVEWILWQIQVWSSQWMVTWLTMASLLSSFMCCSSLSHWQMQWASISKLLCWQELSGHWFPWQICKCGPVSWQWLDWQWHHCYHSSCAVPLWVTDKWNEPVSASFSAGKNFLVTDFCENYASVVQSVDSDLTDNGITAIIVHVLFLSEWVTNARSQYQQTSLPARTLWWMISVTDMQVWSSQWTVTWLKMASLLSLFMCCSSLS